MTSTSASSPPSLDLGSGLRSRFVKFVPLNTSLQRPRYGQLNLLPPPQLLIAGTGMLPRIYVCDGASLLAYEIADDGAVAEPVVTPLLERGRAVRALACRILGAELALVYERPDDVPSGTRAYIGVLSAGDQQIAMISSVNYSDTPTILTSFATRFIVRSGTTTLCTRLNGVWTAKTLAGEPRLDANDGLSTFSLDMARVFSRGTIVNAPHGLTLVSADVSSLT